MILCSRARCGCMASALLYIDSLLDIPIFIFKELKKGYIPSLKKGNEIWAEKCESHKVEVEN